MPLNVLEITEYNGCEFDDYYYDIDNEIIVRVKNSGRIKVINPHLNNNQLKINLSDVHKKCHLYSYNKLIRTCKEMLDEMNE